MIRLIVDAILGLVLLEAAALLMLHRLARRGLPPLPTLSTLSAGFFLLLATRLALGRAPWFALCGVLFLALCAHLLDLWSRWR